jgi:hypothetical protein
MKSSSIFVFIFIGFLIFLVNGEDLDSFDVVTGSTVLSDITTAAPDTGTTANSGNTDAPSSGTDEPVSQGTGETDAPKSTVTSGSTVAPQTTASAPTCPQKNIMSVKDTSAPFTVKIPANLNCTYFARSSSFVESIKVTDVNAPSSDTTLLMFGDSGFEYNSAENSTINDFSTNSGQIRINIVTTTAEADITFNLILEADTCPTNPCQNGGTCSVVQGQPTCKCAGCYIGTTCEIANDPCATYQLVCQVQGKQCTATNCAPSCS